MVPVRLEESLAGRVAVITGASQGIGYAIAEYFGENGVALAICARGEERLNKAIRKLQDKQVEVYGEVCDVSDEKQFQEFIKKTIEKYHKIDILVANAAVLDPRSLVLDTPIDEWRQAIDINLTGIMVTNKTVLPYMIKQNYGRIQNMGSHASHSPQPTVSAYAASKAGMLAFSQAFASEVSEYNIKVNIHYPGSVITPMNPGGPDEVTTTFPCALMLATLPDDGPTGKIFCPRSVETFFESSESNLDIIYV